MTDYLDWQGLYRGGWKGEIAPKAFQHPAKFARRLIARIYDHLLVEKMIQPGDAIVDPFGGVALGALDAMRVGLNWTGVELEEKFVAVGQENIALWSKNYGALPRWGTARLLQGDSRNLAAILATDTAATRSSPPCRGAHNGAVDDHSLIPPRAGISMTKGYGSTKGQLAALKEGDFDAALSSPPYAEARIGETCGAANVGHNGNYGATTGQLGTLKDDGYQAAVSSPPFGQAQSGGGNAAAMRGEGAYRITTKLPTNLYQVAEHGASKDNLGNLGKSETFWTASRQIVEQVRLVLKPNGIAVWVVKDYVRNKERVPFCDQWRVLCERGGFQTLTIARAWMVEEHGVQLAHTGSDRSLRSEHKSFFRRLNEKNGAPRIDFEQVLFMQKLI